MSMLNIGTSALIATQTSLATTSHNIVNVNTEGYSRQHAEQVTYPPNFKGAFYIGSGVTVGSVDRLYDAFLANQVRTYTALESQQDTFLTFAKQADELLGSEELGLNNGLETFFNAVYEVSNDPTAISARQLMLSQAELLANKFNTLDQQLQEFDDQLDNTLRVTIEDINVLSQGIADVNNAIMVGTTSNDVLPNDLLDQRDKLINDLSKLVSVEILTEESGAVSVFIGSGQALVVGTTQIELGAISDTSTTPPRVSVGYGNAQNDISAQLNGGIIGGMFQVRADIIDASVTELDALASAVVNNFNTLQAAGVSLDGAIGTDLFDPTSVTAGTINVVLTNPRGIAASSSTNSGVGNNENALTMANLQTTNTMLAGTQTFSESYGRLVTNIATRTLQADVGQQTQEGLLNQVQLRYDSVSGVNLDEEAANLIKFQQAYQAASQIITVSNTIFNAIINAV